MGRQDILIYVVPIFKKLPYPFVGDEVARLAVRMRDKKPPVLRQAAPQTAKISVRDVQIAQQYILLNLALSQAVDFPQQVIGARFFHVQNLSLKNRNFWREICLSLDICIAVHHVIGDYSLSIRGLYYIIIEKGSEILKIDINFS